jgi:hypothetical protein
MAGYLLQTEVGNKQDPKIDDDQRGDHSISGIAESKVVAKRSPEEA